MSVIRKNQSCVCPRCGHKEVPFGKFEIAYTSRGVLFTVACCCDICNTRFDDYYLAHYDGYSDETGDYNEEGDPLLYED